ncbi:MAG TPA: glycosyltransferase family 39 protein [Phycisphaerae bacterium]|nr:glycosyltransferase family 39 protein [Phycisphaerae bacterium]
MVSLRAEIAIVAVVLLIVTGLAFTSLTKDSMTFDELIHLTAGMSHLKSSDYRMDADNPPLPTMWAALPLALTGTRWEPAALPGWNDGDVFRVGRAWLYTQAEGEKSVRLARCGMIVFLWALIILSYLTSRSLFGLPGAWITLLLMALSPTMLAHGRLIKNDVPSALFLLMVITSCTWFLQYTSVPRLLVLTFSFAAACLTKFSWPLCLPPVAILLIVAILRKEPLKGPLMTRISSRFGRTLWLGSFCGVVAVISVGLIWTVFRFQPAPFSKNESGPQEATPGSIAELWHGQMESSTVAPTSLTNRLCRFALRNHLLPGAYLFGLAQTDSFTKLRPSYLMGRVTDGGSAAYFPIAFALKTPIATMLLVLAGAVALVLSRPKGLHAPLFWALLFFVVVYFAAAVAAGFNIGQRHLLPIYPPLFIFAGAAGRWLQTNVGKVFVGVCALWLCVVNAFVYPQYLAYFNEAVGGPSQGYRYLADSNVDWGQDLLRLSDWARARHEGPVQVSYFGTADPSCYGFACEPLASFVQWGTPVDCHPGTIVVSLNELVGLTDPTMRPEFWNEDRRQGYRRMQMYLDQTIPLNLSQPDRARYEEVKSQVAGLRQSRLISRLKDRKPDDRVGYSMFVYRISPAEFDQLVRP